MPYATIDEENLAPLPYRALIKKMRAAIYPYRALFWLGTFFRFSADVLFLYIPYSFARMVDWFQFYKPGQSFNAFWVLMIFWAIAFAYVTTSRHVGKYFCYRLAERINVYTQLAAIKHLERLDVAWHQKENTGNKLKRLYNGGEAMEKLMRFWVDFIIEIGVNFVGMIIVIAFIDLTVAAILFAFLVTYLLIALPLARRASLVSRAVDHLEEEFSGVTYEIANNIRTVKVTQMFDGLYQLLMSQSKRIIAAVDKRISRYRFKGAVQTNWSQIFRIGAMIVIALGIFHGKYTLAFFVMFNFYFTQLRSSVEEFSDLSQDMTTSRFHLARLQTMLNEPVRIADYAGKSDFPTNWKTITLKNVSFSYGDNEVLHNLSFTVKRGEKIGIVGLSGAGKSTLFKLLLKENEDFTGDILFDNISIRDITKNSFYKKVAVVLQDTEVFNFSLRENITLSDTAEGERSAERVARSLEVAHVTDFVNRLPRGLDTLIGEKGVKLSGGEKQRLGIARAIFKEPEILFLDEATSHLDLESEEKIKDSLHQFFENVTALVIAHRLTTIHAMDRIILIEGGKILESGSFKELYKKQGRFFELWEKQRLL